MIEYLHSFAKLEFDKVISRIESLAATDLGKEKAHNLTPFSSLFEIQASLHCVSEMKHLMQSNIAPPFDGIVDCRPSIHRAFAADSSLSAPELRSIANVLSASHRLKTYFKKRENEAPLLNEIATEIVVDKVLEFNVLHAIDENGEIVDTASKELDAIRGDISDHREKLKDQLDSILRKIVKCGWARDEIITTREGRMVIPVKTEYKHQVPGFIHSASSSGVTVFIEPVETLEMNNEIRSLQFQEMREIDRILKNLTEQVRERGNELIKNVQILEKVDVIFAKAQYSLAIGGSEIHIRENEHLSLVQARHPLLLEQLSSGSVIPFDLDLGKDFNILVITGPNAGGKSVTMKTVGLLTVMVHSGLHVSASSDSVIPFIDKVFVDIGDEQSIEKNLSTFTSHLTKLQLICRQADSSSLVLIDEICTGTDPTEGGALAAAIMKKLIDQKCCAVVTTHNNFLKAFAFESPGIEIASMEFDQVSLTPTYHLRLGIPGRSYALEIAERLGLHKDILSTAKNFLGKEVQKLEGLISTLEQTRQEVENERSTLRDKQKELVDSIAEYHSKLDSIIQETKDRKHKALEEAKNIVEQANFLVEQSIREIREHNAARESITHAKAQIKHYSEEINRTYRNALEESIPRQSEFSVGDYVRLKTGNAVGEVVEIIDKNYLVILSNSSKIRVEKNMLVHAKKQDRPSNVNNAQVQSSAKRQIDLRGMSGSEAEVAVDKFIDTAVLGGLQKVEIIHGKGSGALQKRVREYLKSHSQVKSFRLGEWHEGGVGVTIVELQ